jgi:hypothetical protein
VELEDVIESLQFHDQSLMDEELLFKMVSWLEMESTPDENALSFVEMAPVIWSIV